MTTSRILSKKQDTLSAQTKARPMLHYDMPLFRPPSEGNNLIIQATLGCSFNRCTFCSMYKTKDYVERPLEQVFADIDRARRAWPGAHRVFLADGDAMALPTEQLVAILDKLYATFPNLQRVTSYALPANLLKKSMEELRRLREHGLKLIYFGIESGAPLILKKITKGASAKGMIEGLHKAREAGIKVSATVILGLGGRKYAEEHIDGTLDLVNQAPLNYLSTLQLFLQPEEEAEFYEKFGEPFEHQDDAGMLQEQTRFIQGLNPPSPVIFRSNHASNALPLKGTLPKDKDKLLAVLGVAQTQGQGIRPHFLRGL